jgi:GNAT superfamily N-acetyltransferase
MTEPAIRAAAAGDVDALARLRFTLYVEQEPGIAEPFDDYRERFLAFAAWALGRDDWRGWVAVDGGDELVGNAWLQTVPRVPAPGRPDPSHMGYLTNMYVAPELRGSGLGGRLLETVLDHCRAEGFELVLTFPADTAYGFYERAGFTRPPFPLIHELDRQDA